MKKVLWDTFLPACSFSDDALFVFPVHGRNGKTMGNSIPYYQRMPNRPSIGMHQPEAATLFKNLRNANASSIVPRIITNDSALITGETP